MGWFFRDAEEEAPDEAIAPKATIPAGRYSVSVRLVEAKSLQAIQAFSLLDTLLSFKLKTQTVHADRLPNVVGKVYLERAGFEPQKRKTVVEKETAAPLWNQLFYFEDLEVAPNELEACNVVVDVCDKSRIGKAMIIGSVDLNLAAIYQLPDHEYWNQWFTLTDFMGRRSGSQGEVCLCVTVLKEGEQQKLHLDEKFSDDEEMPVEVGQFETEKQKARRLERAERKMRALQELEEAENERKDVKAFILKVNVYNGRDYPRMDRFGSAGLDAYIKVTCGSAKEGRTRVITSANPDWNQEVVVRLLVPGGEKGLINMPPLRMSVMDRDLASKDDHAASTALSLADLHRRPTAYAKPKWYCFYGGLRGMEVAMFTRMSKLAKRMNAGYVDGAAYRGRTLMSFSLEEENRKNKFARAKKSIPSVLEKMGKEWHCFLHSQILSVELFQTNSSGKFLSLDIGMGLESTSSPSVMLHSEAGSLSGECYANIRCTLAPLLVKIPTPFEGPLAGTGAPDVFVNVNVVSASGTRRVGFCRIPVSELMPVQETMRPISSPTNAEFPNGWTIQGWFPLRADALSNHTIGKSRRAENVKPIGQVLLRLMIRGSGSGKRAAGDTLEDGTDDDAETINSDAEAQNAQRRSDMERKADQRGARVAENVEPEFVEALPTRPFMLRMELYQARDLPAADAHGSSDPFAVLRVGRNIVETHVRHATTSPSWFKELFVKVELPLIVRDKKRLKDGTLVTDDDESSDDQGVLLDPSALAALRDDEQGKESSSDDDRDDYDVERADVKKQKSTFRGLGGGGLGQEFDGIAWWAAPSMNVMVFDRDEGIILGDNDPLSVLSLPLIHPAQLEANRRGDDNFSVIASSVLSFYSKFSLDSDMPDRYDKIANYKVGALSDEPDWYPLRHLNPMKGLSVSTVDSGGYLLMHYELLPMPKEGIVKYAGVDSSFMSASLLRLNNAAIRPLEDRYGSDGIAIEIILLGVRGLVPYRGSAINRPSVEFELNGVTPLYYGSTAHIARSKPSSYPSGPNANYNGQRMRVAGMMTKLKQVRLSLSVRVLENKTAFSHLIATNEHKLRVRDSELNEVSEFVSKLKNVKIRQPTPEELRAIEVAEMSATVTDSEFGFGTDTTLYLDDSDTVTNEWTENDSDDSLSMTESGMGNVKSLGSFSARTMPKGGPEGVTISSPTLGKSQMTMVGGTGGMGRSKSIAKIPANKYKMIRAMDGRRKYIPLEEFAAQQRALKGIKEEGSDSHDDSDSDSDKTYLSGGKTASDASTKSDDEFDPKEDAQKILDDIKKDAAGDSESSEEELESESESEEETGATFDDGTGKLPEWMNNRMMLVGGLLEDEIAPLQFMSIPVYHAKDFADNTSEKELSGYVKVAIRSLPMLEEDTFVVENLLDAPVSKKRAFTETFNRLAKKKRLEKVHEKELARWRTDEEYATVKKEDFDELQRIAGGGPLAAPPTEVTVRIYVIRGRDLRTNDPSGLCDPYLQVNQRGLSKRYGKRDEKVMRTLSPWFYKVYQFSTDIPGETLIDINVYDFQKRGKDILLGTCTFDVEDRWFSPLWSQQLSGTPPLEVRPIYLPGVDMAQGFLELIVEVSEGHDNPTPSFVLTPPPVMEVELRCVTFGARKMVNKDVGGKNDLFFKLSLIGLDRTQTRFSESQETDTHWFATDGRGSFNFRNIFRFELPVTRAALRVSAYDRDLFSANDAIGEVTIPLSSLCRQVMKAVELSPDNELAAEATVEIKTSFAETFQSFSIFDGATQGKWFKLFHPSKPSECQGEVEVMLSLLPVRKAEARPVGKGREAPNRDPELREPVRARLSLLDPLGSLSLILGPEMLRKIFIVGCCLLFVGIFGALSVFVINDVVGAYIQIAIQKQAAAFGMGGDGPKMGPVPIGR